MNVILMKSHVYQCEYMSFTSYCVFILLLCIKTQFLFYLSTIQICFTEEKYFSLRSVLYILLVPNINPCL